jgi:hypothetical protein
MKILVNYSTPAPPPPVPLKINYFHPSSAGGGGALHRGHRIFSAEFQFSQRAAPQQAQHAAESIPRLVLIVLLLFLRGRCFINQPTDLGTGGDWTTVLVIDRWSSKRLLYPILILIFCVFHSHWLLFLGHVAAQWQSTRLGSA